MKYFLDNTFPPKLSAILVILGVDAGHLTELFPADTADVDWIPEIGKRGWIVITGDRNISKRPAEARALEEAAVTSIFMAKGFTQLPKFEMVGKFLCWWPAIAEKVGKVQQGTTLRVSVNGKVEIM